MAAWGKGTVEAYGAYPDLARHGLVRQHISFNSLHLVPSSHLQRSSWPSKWDDIRCNDINCHQTSLQYLVASELEWPTSIPSCS
jgi:hypothetical protein